MRVLDPHELGSMGEVIVRVSRGHAIGVLTGDRSDVRQLRDMLPEGWEQRGEYDYRWPFWPSGMLFVKPASAGDLAWQGYMLDGYHVRDAARALPQSLHGMPSDAYLRAGQTIREAIEELARRCYNARDPHARF